MKALYRIFPEGAEENHHSPMARLSCVPTGFELTVSEILVQVALRTCSVLPDIVYRVRKVCTDKFGILNLY